MKSILFLMCFFPTFLFGQARYEVREVSGTVISVGPSWSFACDRIVVNASGTSESFSFYPYYGKFLTDNATPGSQIKLKVKINLTARENVGKMMHTNAIFASFLEYLARDQVLEILINNDWIPLPEKKELNSSRLNARVFLERRVEDVYKKKEAVAAFLFSNGLAGDYSQFANPKYAFDKIKKGDIISFVGYQMSMEGSVYPVPGVKEVFSFARLQKFRGKIKSLLYKQNNVCIGMVLDAGGRDERVSFPTEFGQRIKAIAEREEEVTIYRNSYEIKGQTPPELHAVISRSDTLKIEVLGFYGSADGHHAFKPSQAEGKITAINRSDRGAIMSIIVGNESYIEIENKTAEQLGNSLKKGKQVEVSGDERIPKEGELYRENYRIITPDRIRLDGKEFILK